MEETGDGRIPQDLLSLQQKVQEMKMNAGRVAEGQHADAESDKAGRRRRKKGKNQSGAKAGLDVGAAEFVPVGETGGGEGGKGAGMEEEEAMLLLLLLLLLLLFLFLWLWLWSKCMMSWRRGASCNMNCKVMAGVFNAESDSHSSNQGEQLKDFFPCYYM